MRTRTVGTQTSLAVSLCFTAISLVGCFRPDVDALTVKLREECRIAPNAPACALEDPEGVAYVYEKWILEEVNTPEEEACLLDVRCDYDEGGDPASDIFRCFERDEFTALDVFGGRADEECAIACAIARNSCGGEEPCGIDIIDACAVEHDACVDACPLW